MPSIDGAPASAIPKHIPGAGLASDHMGLRRGSVSSTTRGRWLTRFCDLAHTVDSLASLLQRAPPEAVVGAQAMLVDARSILELPQLAPGLIADRQWDERIDQRSAWLSQGMERAQHKAIWSRSVAADAERADWGPLLVRRQQHSQTLSHRLIPSGLQDQILRRFSPSWQADAQLLDSNLLPGVHLSVEQQLTLIRTLVASATLRTAILKGVKQFAAQFGPHWHHIDGDWGELRQIADAVDAVRQLVARRGIRPDAARQLIEHEDRTALAGRIVAVEAALGHAEAAWSSWFAADRERRTRWLRGEWQHIPLAALNERHTLLLGSIEQLEDWIQFQSITRPRARPEPLNRSSPGRWALLALRRAAVWPSASHGSSTTCGSTRRYGVHRSRAFAARIIRC